MSDSRRAAVLLPAAVVFGFGAWIILRFPPNHDISWLMYVAGRWLDGAVLYRDIIEVNPPLIIWLSAIPEALARLTGAWPATVFRVLVLLGVLAVLVTCARLLRAWFADAPVAADVLLPLLAYLLVAAPGYDFGQREHIAMLLVLPYLLLAPLRLSSSASVSRRAALACGVLAGIGFSLKPYFLGAWLLPELYLLLRGGRRTVLRPELVALLLTVFLCALLTLLLAPDYMGFVALAQQSYTGFMRLPALVVLHMRQGTLALVALAAWAVARLLRLGSHEQDVIALALAGFLLGVVLQGKGWFYHWLPVGTLALLLLAAVALRAGTLLLRRGGMLALVGGRHAAVVLGITAAVVGVAMTAGVADAVPAQRARMRGKAYQLPGLIQVMKTHGRQGPIAALSTNLQAGFPLVDYVRLPWALRFGTLWVLPGVYPPNPTGTPFPYRAPADMPPAERFQYEAVIADLVRERPTVLIVDRIAPGYRLNGFNYLQYFGQDARFRQLLTEYRELPPVERYRILVRQP